MRLDTNYLQLLLCILFSCLYWFSGSSIAGSISINGGTGQIEINGIEIKGTDHININVNTGCIEGSGIPKAEQRRVSSFNAIDIRGAFDVNIKCQKKQNVEITSDDNIVPHIITKIKGHTLFIYSNKSICPKAQLGVNVSIDDIEKISALGTNDIAISRVNNKRLAMDLDGSGEVQVSGKTGEFVTNILGSVDLNAKDFRSEKVQISISGVGDAVVYASKKLQADISGVGDIVYYGNPRDVTKEITGVGEIEKR